MIYALPEFHLVLFSCHIRREIRIVPFKVTIEHSSESIGNNSGELHGKSGFCNISELIDGKITT